MSTPEPKEVVRRLAIAAADAAYGYGGGASEYSVARVEEVLDGLCELIAAGQAMRPFLDHHHGDCSYGVGIGDEGDICTCRVQQKARTWDAAYAKLCAGGAK